MNDGFLCIHKPAGISSFDAIHIVLHEILARERPKKRIKIGHAGTLDPLADGVIVAAVNRATKLISYVQQQPKTYLATFQLGAESDSEDIETDLRFLHAPPQPEETDILRILPDFTGEILQMPPLYSALKLNGKRAYALARKGHEITLAPRPVMIYDLELADYCYPFLKLKIVCGSGTYIRSLGRDIAKKLGTAAVMAALTRTAVGVFRLEDALAIPVTEDYFARIQNGKSAEIAEYADLAVKWGWVQKVERPHCTDFLRPFTDAVPDWPAVKYDAENQWKLKCGIPVVIPDSEIPADCEKRTDFVAVSAETGAFLALVYRIPDGRFRSRVNFVHDTTQEKQPEV